MWAANTSIKANRPHMQTCCLRGALGWRLQPNPTAFVITAMSYTMAQHIAGLHSTSSTWLSCPVSESPTCHGHDGQQGPTSQQLRRSLKQLSMATLGTLPTPMPCNLSHPLSSSRPPPPARRMSETQRPAVLAMQHHVLPTGCYSYLQLCCVAPMARCSERGRTVPTVLISNCHEHLPRGPAWNIA